ncbi:MAG: bifunctional DNA-formamidopyrimidine glycosylase/DNA-(apurinic or apyrimidinic site) lyase [Rickettsiales bacterium]|nr:bifunctional DNA-formamidopyrimidine glycosylase/DNA-(apurinic or apyrimidinic site) lyase [Rickettsiales bacterium]
MPELPEVETTRRGLLKAVKGKRIAAVTIRRYDLRTPIPATLAKALKGRQIVDVRRRAKYLLIDLDNGQILLAHLGMSGSFVVVKATEYQSKTHDHVIITLETNRLMVFNDPRRFGVIDLIKKGQEHAHALLKHLGPEPFSDEFSSTYLSAQLARRKGAIKPVLMDQKLVVGVGNIYASEALHLCGFHPSTPANKLAKHTPAIIDAIRVTLEAAIQSGGSTLRDYVGAQNEGGYFQHHFQVYGRDSQPCFRCSEFIETSTHAGRSTYWCPNCQSMRARAQKT